uniref:Uncharacterized protein n=1 Tax=Romanomermis culicivorax TaxID=13658 RepID=A0A915JBV8_ROMCU
MAYSLAAVEVATAAHCFLGDDEPPKPLKFDNWWLEEPHDAAKLAHDADVNDQVELESSLEKVWDKLRRSRRAGETTTGRCFALESNRKFRLRTKCLKITPRATIHEIWRLSVDVRVNICSMFVRKFIQIKVVTIYVRTVGHRGTKFYQLVVRGPGPGTRAAAPAQGRGYGCPGSEQDYTKLVVSIG